MLFQPWRGWHQTSHPRGSAAHLHRVLYGWPRQLRVQATAAPDHRELAVLHFNDVYNIESRHVEPVGGAARFAHAVKERQRALSPAAPLVLFSGDVFNPSLISAFTQGKHMVPVLNELGVHAAAVGNHDFDFGLEVLQQHMAGCRFPWLLSNVLDRRTGKPLGGGLRSHVLTWQGLRVGLLGLVEREWLLTIPSLDEDRIEYLDFVEEGRRLARHMWEEQGVDLLVALTHMRNHNDLVLCAQVPAIQLVLGGHDHHFEISRTQPHGTLLVKSGTDFREFSALKVAVPCVTRPAASSSSNGADTGSNGSSRKPQAGSVPNGSQLAAAQAASAAGAAAERAGAAVEETHAAAAAGAGAAATTAAAAAATAAAAEWWERVPRPHVEWERVEITSATPEDPAVAAIVREYAELIDTKMDEPLGWAHVDLEARFNHVRCGESNLGNFFADCLRIALQADVAFFNGGTIRSDQVHRAGQLCMRDFVSMLPFTDELVLLELTGAQLLRVLETGVGSWPQLEGRFLQVSGLEFQFDPSRPSGSRVIPGSVLVGGQPLDELRTYKAATKAYLRGGKDGFECLKRTTILMDGETAPRLATLVQYLLRRIQELNEEVEDDYTPPGANNTNGNSHDGRQQQRQQQGREHEHAQLVPTAAAAAAAVAGDDLSGRAVPLHSTASGSITLESEVFLVDGAAVSSHTSEVVLASLDESHVAQHLHSQEHHHNALDCLYSWDPATGKYGIAPKLEGRIVRMGGGGSAAGCRR